MYDRRTCQFNNILLRREATNAYCRHIIPNLRDNAPHRRGAPSRTPSARVSYTDCPNFFAQPKFPNARSVVVNRCKFNLKKKVVYLGDLVNKLHYVHFIFQIRCVLCLRSKERWFIKKNWDSHVAAAGCNLQK